MVESSGERPRRRQWRYPERCEHPDATVFVYEDWCKCCGICYELCPAGVMTSDKAGRPVVVNPEACTACGLCEILCPEMAITVYAERAGGKGDSDSEAGSDTAPCDCSVGPTDDRPPDAEAGSSGTEDAPNA